MQAKSRRYVEEFRRGGAVIRTSCKRGGARGDSTKTMY